MKLEWLSENEKYLERTVMDYKAKERKFLDEVRRAIPLLKIKKKRCLFAATGADFECLYYYEDNAVGLCIEDNSVSFMGETWGSLDKNVSRGMQALAYAATQSTCKPLIYWRRWLWSLKYRYISKNFLKRRL